MEKPNENNSIKETTSFEKGMTNLLEIVNIVIEVDQEMISLITKIKALGINAKIEASRITDGEDKKLKMAQKAAVFIVISSKTQEEYKLMTKFNIKLKKSLEKLAVNEVNINETLNSLMLINFDSTLKKELMNILGEIKFEFENIVSFNQKIRLILSKIELLSLNMSISSDKIKNGNVVESATFVNFAIELKEITEQIQRATGNMDEETTKIKSLIDRMLFLINEINKSLETDEVSKQKTL